MKIIKKKIYKKNSYDLIMFYLFDLFNNYVNVKLMETLDDFSMNVFQSIWG